MSEDTNELIGSHELYLSDDKIFYTIEGEGEFVGQPSVFMRLSMCNLTCKGFASADSPHGCDSFVSWSIKNKMSFEEIFKKLEYGEIIIVHVKETMDPKILDVKKMKLHEIPDGYLIYDKRNFKRYI